MKKIFIALSIFSIFSCYNLEEENTSICFPAFCGSVNDENMNISIFNDSDFDFDAFYWEINKQRDSITPFPFNQYSCWINLEEKQINHLVLSARVGDKVYQLDSSSVDDTLFYYNGNFSLELSIDEGSDQIEYDIFNYDCKEL